MSRVGNKPIPLPTGVKVTIGDEMLVEGPKGKLRVPISPGIQATQADGQLQFTRDSDQHAPVHGLTRALAASAVRSGFSCVARTRRIRVRRLTAALVNTKRD